MTDRMDLSQASLISKTRSTKGIEA